MLLGSSRPYHWLILEENGGKTDDDDDTFDLYGGRNSTTAEEVSRIQRMGARLLILVIFIFV